MNPDKTNNLDKDQQKNSKSLGAAERFADLLDSRYTFPGTNFKFGLDPILGLIPGVGDGISLVFQVLLVVTLSRKGYSGKLLAMLLINVLLDTLIGSIPVIGQIFDFFFKANQRNLRLTKEYLYEGKHQGSGTGIWIAFFLVLIAALAAMIYVIVLMVRWIASWF